MWYILLMGSLHKIYFENGVCDVNYNLTFSDGDFIKVMRFSHGLFCLS